MNPSLRPLRIAAAVELLSLLVLLVNLATVHLPAVSSLIGPTHGCAYLFVIIATVRLPGTATRTKLLSLVPAIGGVLVLRTGNAAPAGQRQR
ncbi:DUF3817 domain-containing protein [Goodfellowiella coeruleoviolacea]|uniref:DUF3817 domain-containing protein n=1 Tax=Goodfellowiella coeruleoviolacea TaxID=334858 RepID=A0AAE3KJH2_9PSEU|nr:DUF3817 domain-containing protein [Goodfellowiella coeruleoviolacea]MCP2164303.1 hypothetical protein [Goodfellowiella coeruleoviolacea]